MPVKVLKLASQKVPNLTDSASSEHQISSHRSWLQWLWASSSDGFDVVSKLGQGCLLECGSDHKLSLSPSSVLTASVPLSFRISGPNLLPPQPLLYPLFLALSVPVSFSAWFWSCPLCTACSACRGQLFTGSELQHPRRAPTPLLFSCATVPLGCLSLLRCPPC